MDDTDIRLHGLENSPLPPQQPSSSRERRKARVYGDPKRLKTRITCAQSALVAMEDHATASARTLETAREIGGVMLGDVQHRADILEIEIREYLRAESTDDVSSSLTYFVFTQAAWAAIHEKKDARFPDLKIVGWFHSHPNHGIFLSPDDLFIHENFFKQPWQTALVIDPLRHDGGFFVWDEGKVVRSWGLNELPTEGVRTSSAHSWRYDGQQKPPYIVSQPASSDWRRYGLYGLGLVIVLFVVSNFVLGLSNASRISQLERRLNATTSPTLVSITPTINPIVVVTDSTSFLDPTDIPTQPSSALETPIPSDSQPLLLLDAASVSDEQNQLYVPQDGHYTLVAYGTYRVCANYEWHSSPQTGARLILLMSRPAGSQLQIAPESTDLGALSGRVCFHIIPVMGQWNANITLCCTPTGENYPLSSVPLSFDFSSE